MSFREDAAPVAADIMDALGEEAVFNGDYGRLVAKGLFEPEVFAHEDFTGDDAYSPATFEGRTADFARVRSRDTVTIGTVTYEVVRAEHDGYGATRLTLQKTDEY